ncbi:LPD7 domain-containing protein [Phenylobacterium sp.]|uniref:LPD7 domain-containing protein n=1 Tax=Phenylobacterium sp. TaxID=1871053 RepID=UPI00352297E6
MAATKAPNIVVAISRALEAVRADVPPDLLSRYYVDGRGGPGVGFYPNRTTYHPVIRDYGRVLRTDRGDQQTSADIVAIAHRRRWTTIEVHGDLTFRREVWMAASALGLQVRGYTPSIRDQKLLEEHLAKRTRLATHPQEVAPARPAPGRPVHEEGQRAWAPLRVIETLAAARVASPEIRDRLLSQAQARLEQLRTPGRQVDPLHAPLSIERLRKPQDRQR